MFLHSVQLDPRCREARRDLADAYQMHATLSRAFCVASERCPAGEFLWRLEAGRWAEQSPQLLIQAKAIADWGRVGIAGWLSLSAPPLDLRERLGLDSLQVAQRFRFRLRANPTVTRQGKRLGLLQRSEQERWLSRKADLHGFSVRSPTSAGDSVMVPGVEARISQEGMVTAHRHDGRSIGLYSVLYDGVLTVTDVGLFKQALEEGIGHGKAFGLGLLSVFPIG